MRGVRLDPADRVPCRDCGATIAKPPQGLDALCGDCAAAARLQNPPRPPTNLIPPKDRNGMTGHAASMIGAAPCVPQGESWSMEWPGQEQEPEPTGVTPRQWFAGMALRSGCDVGRAVEVADQMLARLEDGEWSGMPVRRRLNRVRGDLENILEAALDLSKELKGHWQEEAFRIADMAREALER